MENSKEKEWQIQLRKNGKFIGGSKSKWGSIAKSSEEKWQIRRKRSGKFNIYGKANLKRKEW